MKNQGMKKLKWVKGKEIVQKIRTKRDFKKEGGSKTERKTKKKDQEQRGKQKRRGLKNREKNKKKGDQEQRLQKRRGIKGRGET